MGVVWDQKELGELRYHWNGAYVINGSHGVWVATRTDNGQSVYAKSSVELWKVIREDYERCPVPR